MNRSVSSRALALLASCAVVFGTIAVASPALADDGPVVVSTPDATPTPDATEPPAEEATEPPADEATPVPSEDPEAEAPDVTDATVDTVDYTGRLVRTSEEDLTELATGRVQLFQVTGHGFLRVDLSRLDLGRDAFSGLTLRLAVPAGLGIADADSDEAFSALAEASLAAPLVATEKVGSSAPRRTSSLVNQTPGTTAVQKVYAVLVTPKGGPSSVSADQTVAKVQGAVDHAGDYWSSQSAGKVDFELAGTVPWYKSSITCVDPSNSSANSDKLWQEAAVKASAQLGYVADKNTHLALFFPSSVSCGNNIGLGSIGATLNDPGVVWVLGTDSPIAYASLSHELGHNLTLGHADWLNCSGSDPHPGYLGTTGCTPYSYGDLVDVMGFGSPGADGGALSSPNAIRSGIWPSSAYQVAPLGTNTYVLNSVSSNTGTRAVVVEDQDGVNYFVEYRDFSGEDAQYAGVGCSVPSHYCVSPAPEVRVLRLEQQVFGPFIFKGFPGDDSYLIGRTLPGGEKRVGYVAGESFKSASPETDGITVSVTSISGGTATVSITKRDDSVRGSYVTASPTYSNVPGKLSVGDTMTAFLEADWTASSYVFTWYRGLWPSKVAVGTGPSYTITQADLGQGISVAVTGSSSGGGSQTSWDPNLYDGWGPVTAGKVDSGTVAIDPSATPFHAVLTGWDTPGASYKYQWYRDSSAISGATTANYTPTSSDRNHKLSVRVYATKSGLANSFTVYSIPADYSLVGTGSISVTGTPKVGLSVTAVPALTFTKNLPAAGTPVSGGSVTFSYQWKRSGTAVGGNSASYALTASDYGKAITVTVTASASGTIAYSSTVALATIAKGDIGGTHAIPVVTIASAAGKLTAALPGGSVDAGTTAGYQWYRGTSAISKATSSSYTMTSSDVGKAISVRVTVKKTGYADVVLNSVAKNYTITASAGPVIGGVLKVGRTLEVSVPNYSTVEGPFSPTLGYQWYRSGSAISGATGASYVLGSSDYAKKITVKVIASRAGYWTLAKTSASTGAVAKGGFAGSLAAPIVTMPHDFALSSELPSGSVTETGTTVKYQWYRGSTAISGKTQSTYTLSPSDYGKTISVKYTISKKNFGSITLASSPTTYSVVPVSGPKIDGIPQVGESLSVHPIDYQVGVVTVVPTLSYQWYRSGVAIVGEEDNGYTLVPADKGKTITVKVTPALPGGLLVKAATSAPTPVIATHTLAGADAVATVSKSSTLKLTATSGVTESGVTTKYQWFHDSTPISKATASSYQLTSKDYPYEIWVRVTVSKPDFVTVVKSSLARTYGIAAGDVPHVTGGLLVTDTLNGFYEAGETDGDGNPATRTLKYQWYRSGVKITGATFDSYTITSKDLGKVLTFAVTESVDGWLPITSNWVSGTIGKLTIAGTSAGPVVSGNGPGKLTSELPGGSVTESGVSYAYQWYRGSTAISGAKSPSYTLTASDSGKSIWVKWTVSKPGYSTLVLISAAASHTLVPSSLPLVTGVARVGEELDLTLPSYSVGVSTVSTDAGPIQWLRSGSVIPGANGLSYVLQAADFGKTITARVTVTSNGTLSNTTTSASVGPVALGIIAGSHAKPNLSVLTGPDRGVASLAGGSVTEPDVVVSWQWIHDYSVELPGFTDATYYFGPSDELHNTMVRVTVSKPGYASFTAMSDPFGYGI